MSEPTTVAPADDTGAEDAAVLDELKDAALPEEQQETQTADNAEQEQTQEESGDEESLPDDVSEKLASFAKGQGIDDLSDLSKRELSILKMAYDNKADRDRNAQNLDKSITDSAREADLVAETPQSDAEVRLRALELKDSVNSFFNQDGIDAELRPKMAEFAAANPNIAYLVENNYLSVSDLYYMVKGSDKGREAELKTQGGREALQQVAKKQQAKAISGNAVSSDLQPPESDPVLELLKAD